MKKFILIDGNAIFHRAFHALPLFKTSSGEYTNAVYGFLKMLIEIIKREKPEYIAVAFDHKEKTLRKLEYDAYKAQRSAPPEQLYPQLPRLKELLEVLKIKHYELQGYEADDLLGTFATVAQKLPDLEVVIVTGDKDALQLVNEKVRVVAPLKGISEVIDYTPEMVKEKTGLTPSQIVDYKALKGDTSDNIKGVQGIGEKTAVEMLQKYGTLESIYNHLTELSAGVQKKLEAGKDDAIFSKRLATLICDAPIEMHLEECLSQKIPASELRTMLEKLEFKGLLKQVDTLVELVQPVEPSQQSMF